MNRQGFLLLFSLAFGLFSLLSVIDVLFMNSKATGFFEDGRFSISASKSMENVREYQSNDYLEKNQNDPSSASGNYCDYSDSQVFEFMTNTTFTLNGNGGVRFMKKYDYEKNEFKEGEVVITGGRAKLNGRFKILNRGKIYIYNLIATDGNYDASNNSSSQGYFKLDCNSGVFSGSLISKGQRGNDLQIVPNL